MPKGFAFPTNEEIWIPLYSEFPPRPRNDPTAVNPAVLGLLKADVSLDQANAEATTIARRLAAAYPETNKAFNTGQVRSCWTRSRRGRCAARCGRCSASASECCSSRA